jgi:hypothetical protein
LTVPREPRSTERWTTVSFNNRGQHGDGRDRQGQFSDGLVSSPFYPLPRFVAPKRAATAGYIGRESLD